MKEANEVYYYYLCLGLQGRYPTIVDHKNRGDANATVCIARFGKLWYRGVAVCSPRDQFSKKDGRNRAYGLAVAAFVNAEDGRPFGPRNRNDTSDYAWERLYYSLKMFDWGGAIYSDTVYRSQSNVILNKHEKGLLVEAKVKSKKSAARANFMKFITDKPKAEAKA